MARHHAFLGNNPYPRTDVGGGTLVGVVSAVVMMVLSRGTYDFAAVAALVGAVLVGVAGYLPARHKNFVMSVAAVAATLIAAVLGKLIYGVEWDNATVSVALSSFLVAAVGYLAPPNAQTEAVLTPHDPPPAPGEERVGKIRHPFT